MKGGGMMRMSIAAALAGLSAPLGPRDSAQGVAVLNEMFKPQFAFDPGSGSRAKPGKHRRSGTVAGAGPKHHTTFWRDDGRKMAAKRLARGEAGDDRNWLQRKAWLERNAHVIAKREADQAKAMGPDGGRNAIHWGRK